MASLRYTLEITLDGTSTEIPALNVTDTYDLYLIKGTAIAIGNYSLVPTGTPVPGLTYKFQYTGNLDITTNTKTFSLFGYNVTQTQLSKGWEADCYYNGTSWEVTLKLDFSESAIIENFQLGNQIIQSNNLATNAITSSNITNGSITLNKLATDSVDSSKIVDGTIQAIDLGTDCVTTSKILDLNVTTNKVDDLAVTTNKLANQAVTTVKIANSAITNTQLDNLSVDTQNIIDNSVTNAKLATGTPSSIKICNNLGEVTELPLGLDELPIGDGTSITAVNKSSLTSDTVVFTVPLSFESGELTDYWITTNDSFELLDIHGTVNKAIEPSDIATIITRINGVGVDFGYTPIGAYELSSGMNPLGILFYMNFTGTYIASPIMALRFTTIKPTPGGKVILTIRLKKI